MSLESIYKFQSSILQIFKSDTWIKSNTSGVFLELQSNTKTPFIWINFLEAEKIFTANRYAYIVRFDVCIFAKDREGEHDSLMSIGNRVIDNLSEKAFELAYHQIVSIKDQKFIWNRLDGIIKLTINYESYIRQS